MHKKCKSLIIPKLKEECGVFGVYNADELDVAKLTYYGLYALQHRGQESAGIAVNDSGTILYHKDMGLVPEVFNEVILGHLKGKSAIGHVRYSTTGASLRENAQPVVIKYRNGQLALAHNGNLVNSHELRNRLEEQGAMFQTSSDSEVILSLISRNRLGSENIEEAIVKTMKELKGSYALCLLTPKRLIGIRDPLGIRPLCIGKIENSFLLASESCALDAVGAEFLRDVLPGEIVLIDDNGINSVYEDISIKSECDDISIKTECEDNCVKGESSVKGNITECKDKGVKGDSGVKGNKAECEDNCVNGTFGIKGNKAVCDKKTKTSLCIFEFVYFARPDSFIDGVSVHGARMEAGRKLAIEHPVDADLVIGAPDSGLTAALGYSEQSGIPYGQGLLKNRYVGRTFIQPNQVMREQTVMLKFNAMKSAINGKRIVMIDDSIVRGTTTRRIVQMLKNAGAKEVHMRVSSPPIRHPCHFGVDITSGRQLVASNSTVEEIKHMIGADSLGYLSIEGLMKTPAGSMCGFCNACFTGSYPLDVPDEANKLILDR